jgi:4-hydroxybenzoate polyprenyltransferase
MRVSAPFERLARRGRLHAVLALMRPDQWVKNGFVLGGLVFGQGLLDPVKVEAVLTAFVLFCLVSSAAYVLNDVADLEADRGHPRKRRRPIAAGEFSLAGAQALYVVLMGSGFVGALVWVPAVFPYLVAYALLNIGYSFGLRRFELLDVISIATGFVLRVQAGCAAMPIDPSAWILLCSFVLALFLGFGKRRFELVEGVAVGTLMDDRRATYETRFLDHMMSISSAVVIVCYTMFTLWPTTVAVHGTDDLIYTVPFVIYGVFRYQWAIYHGGTSGDPGDFVWRDRPLMAAIVLWGLACLVLVYGR